MIRYGSYGRLTGIYLIYTGSETGPGSSLGSGPGSSPGSSLGSGPGSGPGAWSWTSDWLQDRPLRILHLRYTGFKANYAASDNLTLDGPRIG